MFNAILGSGLLIFWSTMIGTPLGILAGIYLAEYGKTTKLASIIRFINDILLSAPSIIIGLFIYGIVVVKMGHFPDLAAVIALVPILVPIAVRTQKTCCRCQIPREKQLILWVAQNLRITVISIDIDLAHQVEISK